MTDAMPTFTLTRDGDLDLRFAGQLLAEVSSRRATRPSRPDDRWTEIALYRAQFENIQDVRYPATDGPFVVHVIGRLRLEGEHDWMRPMSATARTTSSPRSERTMTACLAGSLKSC